jgi:hypothetical protein
MVKYIKYAVIALTLTIITIIVLNFFGKTTPEEQIKNQLTSFLAKASKSSGDKLSTGLLKSKSLENFFAPYCKFQVGVSSFSGTYTPVQIFSNSMRARSMFKYVKFSAHDIEIILKTPETATVNFTGSINGLTKRGKSVDDYKELTCKLRLVEGNWLIYSVSIREIIKK